MANFNAALASNPDIWSSRIRWYLDRIATYAAALTNSNFEGEVKAGSTLRAFYVADASVTEYTGAWIDGDWTELAETETTLVVDQFRKALAKVPDARDNGSVLNLIDQASNRIAKGLADDLDDYIASLYTTIATANEYGNDTTPIVVGFGAGETLPTVALSLLRKELVDAQAPTTNPRVVIPTWMGTMLEQEIGARQTAMGDNATAGNQSNRQGLLVRNIAGFSEIYVSTAVPNTTGTLYKVMAGDPLITLATALDRFETIRLQNDFATGVRGLMVYGAASWRDDVLALGTFNTGAYKVNA